MATRLIVFSADDGVLFSGESASAKMRAAAPARSTRPTLLLVDETGDDVEGGENDYGAPEESGVFSIKRSDVVPSMDAADQDDAPTGDFAVCG